jgi:hypothetical protein
MELFHFTVLTIAIIFFIIIIISFSILLSYKKNNIATYPPSMNSCPDYWAVSTIKDVSGCVINASGINVGELRRVKDSNGLIIDKDSKGNTYDLSGKPKTYGLKGNNIIDFADSAWSSGYSSTNRCALKTWSNQYNIVWDGVSNYNSC